MGRLKKWLKKKKSDKKDVAGEIVAHYNKQRAKEGLPPAKGYGRKK